MGIIPNAIFFVLENLGGVVPIMATYWIFTIAVGIISSISTYVLFVKEDEPIINLSKEFKILIDDFEEFFNHPNSAMIPNPFDKEPEYWKLHFNLANRGLFNWYVFLKERVLKSNLKNKIDIDELKNSVLELSKIIKYYLIFSEDFVFTAKQNSLSEGVRERYNKKFVNEFNTVFRTRLLNYFRAFSKVSGFEEIRKIKIESATLLE